MSKFRKKPIVVDAFRLGYDPWPDWFSDMVTSMNVITRGVGVTFDDRAGKARDTICADIKTLEGWMLANDGDWIIRGVKGELYPCKPDIFALTYEPDVPTEP